MRDTVLEDACDLITDGTHHSPPNVAKGDFLYVTSKNVRPGRIDLSDISYVTADVHASIYARCPVLKGDVLYVKDGVNAGTAAVNSVSQPFSMLSSVALIRPKSGVLDARYLVHWLNSDEGYEKMIRTKSGSAITRLILREIRRCRIPHPPFAQQRRIADILDRAESLRAKRRAALAKLDTLTQAIFTDLFGDPVRNEKRYPIFRLGGVCDVRDGTHDSPNYISDGGYPLVTSKNLSRGVLDLSEVNYISEEDYLQINKRSQVSRGDIIMPMIGTIGSPVLVDHEPNYAIKNVALFKFRETSPSAIYVRQLLSNQYFDHIIGQKNRGGTQKFVSLGDLRAFPLPLPPHDRQHEFARRVAVVEQLKSSHRSSLAQLDALFASLQHRAFRGEL